MDLWPNRGLSKQPLTLSPQFFGTLEFGGSIFRFLWTSKLLMLSFA